MSVCLYLARATKLRLVALERFLRADFIPHIVFTFSSKNSRDIRVQVCGVCTNPCLGNHCSSIVFEMSRLLNRCIDFVAHGTIRKNFLSRSFSVVEQRYSSSHSRDILFCMIIDFFIIKHHHHLKGPVYHLGGENLPAIQGQFCCSLFKAIYKW